ncbi:MAG: hypothetical protein JO110_26770 [Acetobacteraceae bacterium]|nr:hypothetical protein [Acetobacteraceae bacterium]
MRAELIVALAAAGLISVGTAPGAEAKGCIKGAIVGGVAGHYAGHGVLGAMGGCVVGRHLAKKQEQQQQQQNAASSNSSNQLGGSAQSPSSTPYGGSPPPAWGNSGSNPSNPGSVYTGGAYQR